MLTDETHEYLGHRAYQMESTSDDISREELERILELEIEIVNASAKEDSAMVRICERRLFEYLDDLETKYGPLPRILDRRADFTDDPMVRLTLYNQAYVLADARGDVCNQLCIASSLGRLYIEDFRNVKEGQRWLDVVKEHLKRTGDDTDVEEYEELKADLERLTLISLDGAP